MAADDEYQRGLKAGTWRCLAWELVLLAAALACGWIRIRGGA